MGIPRIATTERKNEIRSYKVWTEIVTALLYHQTLIQVKKLNMIKVYGEPHYRTDIGCGAKESPTSI